MELLELVMKLVDPSGKWFRGPKRESLYWSGALIALVCWTVIAVPISVVADVWLPGGGWLVLILGLLILPVWVAFAIGWRSEFLGVVVGVGEWLLLFSFLSCWLMLAGPESVTDFVFFSVVVPLPPLAVTVVCLVGWWRSRPAEREKRERVRREHYEAARRYHQTGESLRGVDLSRCDLIGIELPNADLRGANLVSADLSSANLEGANLSRAELDGANLQGAILRDATLDGAYLRRANLRDAKLQRAILWGANLYKADLRGANLQEANLLRAFVELARLDNSTVMPEGWRSSAGEELADLPPKPKRFPDFSPMPQEFGDFAGMLEEAKEKSGTLICYECGHDNPVGQTQCEECGEWVPQTAKARWSYGKDK